MELLFFGGLFVLAVGLIIMMISLAIGVLGWVVAIIAMIIDAVWRSIRRRVRHEQPY